MERWISVIDLLSFPESKKVVLEGNEEELKELLFNIGMDISEDYLEYQVCLHRPLTYIAANKNPVYTGRWFSEERRDDVWMESEHCTRQNKLERLGTKDLEFMKELIAMSQYPNYTGDLINHMKNGRSRLPKVDTNLKYELEWETEEGEACHKVI